MTIFLFAIHAYPHAHARVRELPSLGPDPTGFECPTRDKTRGAVETTRVGKVGGHAFSTVRVRDARVHCVRFDEKKSLRREESKIKVPSHVRFPICTYSRLAKLSDDIYGPEKFLRQKKKNHCTTITDALLRSEYKTLEGRTLLRINLFLLSLLFDRDFSSFPFYFS